MSTHIRVSEILAQFRDYSAIDVRVLNTKALIGTEVHHNIHMHTKGMFPMHEMFPVYDRGINITSWQERGEGYFNSYLEYEKENKPKYQINLPLPSSSPPLPPALPSSSPPLPPAPPSSSPPPS